ncbi:hypothetical protein AMTR_s00110p00116310 [Amborella trichopoda]|uniref:Uncharacterized protein n=1 Tax=Amborella trichopoda TaxID=13333 RepID=W1NSA4_AMBTC|nr:hypothetical protein AMTR_s00110p00116310 [Amborella trichopoda]
MTDIEVDTANVLPSEEYKAWYSRVSHPNVANPLIDILQPYNQEEEEVSAVQASTTMLAEAITLRQKWYPEVYSRVNNSFEMLSKFVSVDMENIEARMEVLQCEVNEEVVQEEGRQDVVGESNQAVVDDLAPSTQLAVEERRRHNTRQKQYQPKRRRHPKL